jgi:predicted RNA polymerase sigma factor
VNESLLRELVPEVIGVQDALVEAVGVWPEDPPRDPKGWLVTVAWVSAV